MPETLETMNFNHSFFYESASRLKNKEEKPKENMAESLSWADRVKSMGRPRKLEYVEKNGREERAAKIESSIDLHRFSLWYSAEYSSAHACEETPQRWRKNHQKGLRETSQTGDSPSGQKG